LPIDDGAGSKEFTFDRDPIRLGRASECDVVVESPTVSRHHAEIRRTAAGWELVDIGSSNGTWVGDDRVTASPLADGQEFRLGRVRLRFELVRPAASLGATVVVQRASLPVPPSETRPASSAAAQPSGSELRPSTPPVPPPPAAAGSAPAATPAPQPGAAPSAAARPSGSELQATTPPVPPIPTTAPATAGSAPAPPAATSAPRPGASSSIPRPAAETKGTGTPESLVDVINREGELVLATGNRPFLLSQKDTVWYLEEGKVEVFTVALDANNKPTGARTHFVSVEAGQVMFGMDLIGFAMGSGFLAVGRMGTQVRALPVSRLRELGRERRFVGEIAALVDGWVDTLSRSLTKEITPGPLVDVNLAEGEEKELYNQQRARSSRGVLWLDVVQGNLLFIGMEELVFEREKAKAKPLGHSMQVKLQDLFAEAQHPRVLFPVTADTWIEASNARDLTTNIRTLATAEIVGDAALWRGLDLFHRTLCQCEFINKRLAAVDEFNRLKTKAQYAEAAGDAGYRDIAGVLEAPGRERVPLQAAEGGDLVFEACRVVGQALDMQVKNHPEANRQASFQDRVGAVAKASQFRTRNVVLRDDWYRRDQGPILGRWDNTSHPVAILPTGPDAYEVFDPKTGQTQAVDEGVAGKLASFGIAFYRPFPSGNLTALQLMRFGARGLGRDAGLMILMGIALGLLGAITPYFTGRIFDGAIPQADRSLLLQFTMGLLVGALVSTAFKVTQSLSLLRIQGKMDYSIQAALWDRVLNLPTTFFRGYSAGDLADRTGGIDEIRRLVAGAGLGALLGSLSSIFYVFLLFKYSLVLAFVAIGLTLVYVSFTTTANYMQLRQERQQMTLQGKITGMVLQFISGVAKLRVAGAENHAFRVWAGEYAHQRRLEFTIGKIKNAVQVFGSGFPVLSSLAIFYALVKIQEVALQKGQAPPMSTGDFIAFNAAFMAFLTATQALGDASLDMLRVVPVYERLKPLITTPAELDETKAYPGHLKGGIEVSHVSFRYAEDSPWILDDLTVKIAPGELVAFVGGSGCGKSTLMRLLLGFETAQKGSIYFDGQDLATLDLREVRQQIGVVLQTSKLLPTDIFRNIIGNTDLTQNDAWEAATLAGLADDIRQLPMGMHTYISEGGGGFSGGQQQKLLVARAQVRRPRILIFDEATSALDNRSQKTVTESMERLQATRIVIAHRLSTIINADRICYLEGGRVIEMGTYDELMKLDGKFALLARRQMA
jgi:NHLM bacteriocin system ABC transporter ATP-binding protein